MKSIYESFEFSLILQEIQRYVKGEVALNRVKNLSLYEDKIELKKELCYLNEVLLYTLKYRNLIITPHKDIFPLLSLLKKGGVGNIDFFYQVSSLLENSKRLKDESNKDESFPLLMEQLHKLEDIESLKHQIDRVITKDLEIADSASSTLKDIRKSIKNEIDAQQKIIASLLIKYKDFLNDERIALKNSAYALPIKSGFKGKVDGAIVDVSDTGNTSFIEPYEIITSNAKIQRLRQKEQEEIHRILVELSDLTRKYVAFLEEELKVISYLDFLLAKANYAIDNDMKIAKITDERIIKMKGARHPLIAKEKVVKNNFYLDKQKMMVITGPNAGGKTVALKTIGLLVLMCECGLAIPTDEEAEIFYISNIFVDIGDNQSLMDNLSTFSGHISNIVSIVDKVDESSLVILDELGTGTSPLDGEALALGVINYLHEVNCFAILTSHYDGLKSYAIEHDYILNASMDFDEEHITPTYRLRLGVAGRSYGLEVASRLGIKDEVFTFAKEYLQNKKKSDRETTLAILQQRIEDNERINFEIENRLKEVEEEKKELIRQQNILKNLREEIKNKAEIEKEKLIDEAKEEIDRIVEEFKKNNDVKLHEVIKVKHEIQSKLDVEEEDDFQEEISINDYVRISSSSIVGKVIQIKGNNLRILTEEGMQVNAKINQVTKFNKKKVEKKKFVSPYSFKATKKVPLECNLIGLYCEEGLQELDKYLDDAIVANYKEVRIIHGSGTGKLRNAVHDYLRRRKEVKSFRLGGMGEGGVGATVVYLK